MARLLLGIFVLGTTVLAAPELTCPGYTATNIQQTDSHLTADLTLPSSSCSLYGNDITNLKLIVEYQTGSLSMILTPQANITCSPLSDTRLHVLLQDAGSNIYQVQEQFLPRPISQNASAATAALHFSFKTSPFSFEVIRVSTGQVLFDTSAAPLIFESQYVRLRTKLPQDVNLYGLGEHSDDFRLATTNYTRTLWNAESPYIPRGQNLYGSHPVYFDHRGVLGTHGVFLLNSNGMDIIINQTEEAGEQYLEYNTIGGVLDFYFLAGPEPAAVSKQYAEVVGLPALPPYWSLGFHQCKYGWPSVDYVAEVVANYSAAGIPLEVVWGDIDYMDAHQDFTTDPVLYPLDRMRALVDSLHQHNQRYVMILDPGIHNQASYDPFARGAQKDVFLKAADGSHYRGNQWAGEVVWPDWLAANTQDWWTNEVATFFNPATGIDIDGLWNDMNEASNFCPDVTCLGDPPPPSLPSPSPNNTAPGTKKGLPGRNLFAPPYPIHNHRGPALSGYTLFTNITAADGTALYDTHNLYGTAMAAATRAALLARRPAKRPFVLTRSTFAGAGRVAAHWFGDNDSSWAHYRASIAQLLAFAAVHAMPMVGSDVCGFNGDTSEHLCARWATLGAFQPFYRNHADVTAASQEFYRWDVVAAAARKAMGARYRLLDYLYTALRRAGGREGRPVASPLWFWWPGDERTFGVQTQWMLGEALMVAPVVEEEGMGVDLYLPGDVWFDFWTGGRVEGGKGGEVVRLDGVGWEDIPVFVRGGTVVPMRVGGIGEMMTTEEVRGRNFTIVVAPGGDGMARGGLFLDDGESVDVGAGGQWSEIEFVWDGGLGVFEANGTFGFGTEVVVESVVVLGGGEGGVGNLTVTGPWGLGEAFGFHL
ncbi:glycosyl hydrolases family 31-domain-containing protein [Bombardia bombarda]|uniref:alpha-glucosidase n=1 Tax=Bombardia bombarda TaxID=252184 RepID=A0AA39X0G9_9PEZI|nr:glycosyl hydrolases family 31-domain-containing protein [Bombardia bombarda]